MNKASESVGRIMANIQRHLQNVQNIAHEQLTEVGHLIIGESDEMVPVDYGVLKNSSFVEVSEISENKIRLRVGYTAAYAAWVHEAPGTLKGKPRPKDKDFPARNRGRFWDSGEPQFLLKAVYEIQPEILEILTERG